MNVNKVIMLGRLGRDPEILSGADGRKIAKFSIAMSEYSKNKVSGEKTQITEWANVVVLNDNLTKVVEEHLKKGLLVYIEGKFRTRKWTSKGGENHYSTDVVVGPFGGRVDLMTPGNGEFRSKVRSEEDYGAGLEDRPSGAGFGDKPKSQPIEDPLF